VCRLGLICNEAGPVCGPGAPLCERKEDFIDILLLGCRAAGCVPDAAGASPPPCVPAMLPADVAAGWVVAAARDTVDDPPPPGAYHPRTCGRGCPRQ
jgi:hypothetical protein